MNKLEETSIVTEDMKLPVGSAVIQCVLHVNEDGQGGHMDVRAITVGCDHLDMNNPAHRWLHAVSIRMEEIMRDVAGEDAAIEHVDSEDIERGILAANDVYVEAPKPGEVLSLSNGQTVVVQDESPLAGVVNAETKIA